MFHFEWSQFQTYLIQAEQEGFIRRTFLRLHPERQQAVIFAILDEAIERGPSALNIKNVAHRAHVSIGSLYQYFGDRDTMLNFGIELCARYMMDTFNQYRPYLLDLPLKEALSAYLLGGIEWSRAEASLLQLFARAAYQGDPVMADRLVRPIAATLRGIVGDIIDQAVRRGEIRADIDQEAISRLVHALTIVTADSQLLPYLNHYFQVSDGQVTPERSVAAFLDLVLNGISATSCADR